MSFARWLARNSMIRKSARPRATNGSSSTIGWIWCRVLPQRDNTSLPNRAIELHVGVTADDEWNIESLEHRQQPILGRQPSEQFIFVTRRRMTEQHLAQPTASVRHVIGHPASSCWSGGSICCACQRMMAWASAGMERYQAGSGRTIWASGATSQFDRTWSAPQATRTRRSRQSTIRRRASSTGRPGPLS